MHLFMSRRNLFLKASEDFKNEHLCRRRDIAASVAISFPFSSETMTMNGKLGSRLSRTSAERIRGRLLTLQAGAHHNSQPPAPVKTGR